MLQIETEVRSSLIHGFGLFATQRVALGRTIWRFTPGFDLDLNPSELDRLSNHERARMMHYGYIDHQLNRFVLCCDDARFINHSTYPNIASDRSTNGFGIDVAIRDIFPGDEITIDYATFETHGPEHDLHS